MTLRQGDFFDNLNRLFPQATFLIAYSGGIDSSVLLHLCAQAAHTESRKRFLAVHVNHGMHSRSAQWAEFCGRSCASQDVPLRIVTPDWRARPGQSLEESARNARYAALLQLVSEGTVVLTAQHRDDQAETILLQLFRGSGLPGLAGMPESIVFGPGILHRPLLRFSRQSIECYATSHAVNWIDDPSNADTAHDRNYLRHEIIPRIRKHWPAMDKTLARSGKHCADAQKIIDAQTESWFQAVVDRNRNTLRISKLIEFDETRQRSILRYWIRRSGFRSPSENKLQRIIREAITAASDRLPKIEWIEAEVRRYRDELYISRPVVGLDRDREIPWSTLGPLPIPELGGVLECCGAESADPGTGILKNGVRVRFRTGGERCRLPGRRGNRSLKKIFQEMAVPPWQRDRIPLIYIDNELAAIGDLVVCEPFQNLGLEFHWIPLRLRD